jgi:hypothetical protein
MGGACSTHGRDESVYKILVGKPEENRPVGRSRRWGDIIRVDLREIGWEGVNWIHLAQDRKWLAFVNTVMNFRVP